MRTANTTSAKINLSNLMKAAWAMIKKAEVTTLSEALRKAWAAMKAKALMAKHTVKISFRKADGTIREALATLANITYQRKTDGKNHKPCYSTIAYFDLEKNAFRSFSISKFIGIQGLAD